MGYSIHHPPATRRGRAESWSVLYVSAALGTPTPAEIGRVAGAIMRRTNIDPQTITYGEARDILQMVLVLAEELGAVTPIAAV